MEARLRAGIGTILAVWLLLGASTAVAAADARLRVGVLFGSGDVGVWPQQFSAAFLRHPALRDRQPAVVVSMEFLALMQGGDQGRANVVRLLQYQQQTDPLDVVVAVQGPASGFLMAHGDEIYPGVPRLYVIPGREARDVLDGREDSAVLPTAIVDAIAGTLTAMTQVVPGLKRVWIVTGSQIMDQIYLDHARAAVDAMPEGPDVEFLHGLSLDVLATRLADPPPDTAVLLLTYEGDPEGNIYRTVPDVLPRLLEVSAAPVFAAYDSMLGVGAVGGVMTSARSYGEQAARMALAIAEGGSGAVAAGEPSLRTAFDVAALRHFGLSPERIPAGAELINDAAPGYLEYLWEIVLALVIIVVQLGLIVTLWHLLRQRQRTERALTARSAELSRQKTLFESVINSIPDAVVITDVDAVIIGTNARGFSNTFGYDPARIIGEDTRALTAGGRFPVVGATSTRARVLDFLGHGNRRFPGEWAGTPVLTDEEEHLGYVLVIRDVSARLAAEEERRQAHKMEALGSLAGGIAHDFNNILTVMLGNAELIESGIGDAQDSLRQIMRAGNRARELVGQILAFSRRGASQEMGRVDLGALVDESASFLKTSLPSSVALDVKVEPGATLTVHGNEGQLQQVLMNLGANARDAIGPSAGRLSIRVEHREVDRGTVVSHGILQKGTYVSVEVADSGPGMSLELQQRVFDPFFTTKGPGEGTGMGLALVYGIIQSHGGAIDLRSTPDQGSTFTLYLPALDAALLEQMPPGVAGYLTAGDPPGRAVH